MIKGNAMSGTTLRVGGGKHARPGSGADPVSGDGAPVDFAAARPTAVTARVAGVGRVDLLASGLPTLARIRRGPKMQRAAMLAAAGVLAFLRRSGPAGEPSACGKSG